MTNIEEKDNFMYKRLLIEKQMILNNEDRLKKQAESIKVDDLIMKIPTQVYKDLITFSIKYFEKSHRQNVDWFPITSAPKDGSYILGWCNEWKTDVNAVRYLTALDKWNTVFQPTHWTPLPLPPKPDKDNK